MSTESRRTAPGDPSARFLRGRLLPERAAFVGLLKLEKSFARYPVWPRVHILFLLLPLDDDYDDSDFPNPSAPQKKEKKKGVDS